MDIEFIRNYCLKKKGVNESFPFGENTLVFKIINKIFLLASLDEFPLTINLKCDPEKAVEIREKYNAVVPGYHMNKLHWNTVTIEGSIPQNLILGWIDDSYELVKDGLKKSERDKLNRL
jgi:predicted DNA-binding protein (MmcQ/YjbR family)